MLGWTHSSVDKARAVVAPTEAVKWLLGRDQALVVRGVKGDPTGLLVNPCRQTLAGDAKIGVEVANGKWHLGKGRSCDGKRRLFAQLTIDRDEHAEYLRFSPDQLNFWCAIGLNDHTSGMGGECHTAVFVQVVYHRQAGSSSCQPALPLARRKKLSGHHRSGNGHHQTTALGVERYSP